MKPVLIYQDYVHNNAVLFNRLCRHYGDEATGYCDAADIQNGALKTARLLVMPGGADLYNCEKLGGNGADLLIQDFVSSGGAYLGICAGAYYGCAEILWDEGGTDEIAGSRTLGFYPGRATGPVKDFIEQRQTEKSWQHAAAISTEDKNYTVLYNGGPLFTMTGPPSPEIRILARYDELPGQPPAIIECIYGKGLAILSSPHIEYGPDDCDHSLYRHRNMSYEWEKIVADQMTQGNPAQDNQALFEALIARLYPRSDAKS